jgi:uncharacterized protein HemX
MNLDLKNLSTVIALIGVGAGIAGTWAVMSYRMDELQKRVEHLENTLERVQKENEAQVEEVKCLICKTNNIPCPGC